MKLVSEFWIKSSDTDEPDLRGIIHARQKLEAQQQENIGVQKVRSLYQYPSH